MSLAADIVKAVGDAKSALGDLVRNASLLTVSSAYNVATGENVETVVETIIEYAPEDFSDRELEGELVKETDLKIIVFNTLGTLNIRNQDKIRIDGVNYEVYRVRRVYVGGSYPIMNVYLKV